MKHIIFLIIAVCSASQFVCAQQSDFVKAKEVVTDHHLDVTWHKTTVLIFPSAIKDADRGESYILAERPEGVENVLKVKAGKRYFQQSNLHVVTTDGKVYAFTINYNENPNNFTIDMGTKRPHSPVRFEGISLNSRDMELAVATLKGVEPFVRNVKKSRYGMQMRLEGIFVLDDVLFFRYRLKNNTQIRYDGTPPRFYIRDKKRAKRTAVQDTEVEPLIVYHIGEPEKAAGQTIIAAFKKFTIADSKNFVTEFGEIGGDRELETHINQKKLLLARALE